MNRHDFASSWPELDGKIAPEVLNAPKTGGDRYASLPLPMVQARTVKYIDRHIVGEPWANHLALIAAVLTAYNRDASTVYGAVRIMHARFRAFFSALNLREISDWDPEKHIPLYLQRQIVPEDTSVTRAAFISHYISATKALHEWMSSLPSAEQQTYQPFILPRAYSHQFNVAEQNLQTTQQAQHKRKTATDAVVPYFADLRAKAHLRHNQLARLRTAYQRALEELKKNSCALPFHFSFEEGQERLHFRIWDHRTFVLSHPEHYSFGTLHRAKYRYVDFAEDRESHFLELVKSEPLTDSLPSDPYWFIELLRKDLLNEALRIGPKEKISAKIEWFRQWGYVGEKISKGTEAPFYTAIRDLLMLVPIQTRRKQSIAEGVIIPVESLYAGATFGLLAISLFTTTGMRSNEALQIHLGGDCFFRVVKAAPPGAKDPTPRIRYGFRLIPKGERRDLPQDYFIGQETYQVVVTTAKMLKEHYGLREGEALPLVPFRRTHARAHRFAEARYLFQYNHMHFDVRSINACIRFLMHGMVFPDRDGNNVILTAHLLRHAFATYLAHVERVPIDFIGAVLHHKHRKATEYYSQATDSIIAAWQDRYLDSFAAHINLDEAILRTPEALQEQLAAALEKTGTVHQTLGGDCTLHAFCPIQFACIGCAANVPDPAKRYQVEREQQHATAQVKLATDEGRYPDAQRWRQLGQRCAAFLKEMDQIEAYRKDAACGVTIRIEDIK